MSKLVRRLKMLWWLSGIITEWPPVIKGEKPIKIKPRAEISNGEMNIYYEAKE